MATECYAGAIAASRNARKACGLGRREESSLGHCCADAAPCADTTAAMPPDALLPIPRNTPSGLCDHKHSGHLSTGLGGLHRHRRTLERFTASVTRCILATCTGVVPPIVESRLQTESLSAIGTEADVTLALVECSAARNEADLLASLVAQLGHAGAASLVPLDSLLTQVRADAGGGAVSFFRGSNLLQHLPAGLPA